MSDREGEDAHPQLGVSGERSPLCRDPATQSCSKTLSPLPRSAKPACDLLRPFLPLPHTWHSDLGIC